MSVGKDRSIAVGFLWFFFFAFCFLSHLEDTGPAVVHGLVTQEIFDLNIPRGRQIVESE